MPGQATDGNGRIAPAMYIDGNTVMQRVAVSGTSAASAAFGANTRMIRICADTDCYFRFGSAPTALTTDLFLAAGTPEYWGVKAGDKIAVIQKSAPGGLTIAEF